MSNGHTSLSKEGRNIVFPFQTYPKVIERLGLPLNYPALKILNEPDRVAKSLRELRGVERVTLSRRPYGLYAAPSTGGISVVLYKPGILEPYYISPENTADKIFWGNVSYYRLYSQEMNPNTTSRVAVIPAWVFLLFTKKNQDDPSMIDVPIINEDGDITHIVSFGINDKNFNKVRDTILAEWKFPTHIGKNEGLPSST